MALPQTDEDWKRVDELFADHVRRQHQLLIDMLGQWVSELEPVVVYGRDPFMGPKGIAALRHDGEVIVKNPHWSPGLRDFMEP